MFTRSFVKLWGSMVGTTTVTATTQTNENRDSSPKKRKLDVYEDHHVSSPKAKTNDPVSSTLLKDKTSILNTGSQKPVSLSKDKYATISSAQQRTPSPKRRRTDLRRHNSSMFSSSSSSSQQNNSMQQGSMITEESLAQQLQE